MVMVNMATVNMVVVNTAEVTVNMAEIAVNTAEVTTVGSSAIMILLLDIKFN